jgi:hypothetical protein
MLAAVKPGLIRRLINLLTGPSILLCAAFLVLWGVSHFRCGEYRFGTGRPYGVFQFVAGVNPGRFRLGTVRERLADDDPDPRRGQRWHWRCMYYGPGDASARRTTPTWLNRLGFDRIRFVTRGDSFARNGRQAQFEFDTVGLPFWLLAGAAAALPAARWRRRRRLARRAALGRCHACGYDLRASPGRCPECGRTPEPTAH